MSRPLCVMQLLPELEVGGVERGTVEIARALTAAGHRAIVVSAGGALVDELTACGATHIELPIGHKHPGVLRHVKTLRALYREHGVDVVHARSRLPAWIGWLARRGLAGAEQPRWVTTVHGPYSVNRYSRIMTSGEVVIAISDFIRGYIETNYPKVDPARIRVIPRGVDTRRYHHDYTPDPAWTAQFLHENPACAGKQLLTLPGRLTRWKGQLDFVRVMRALVDGGAPVHGLIVGAAHPQKPQFERELRAAIAAAGLQDQITLLGNRPDLREILALSTCAYSITIEPEAFGRTTIEALALGTPVIGYAHGGTGEILAQVFPRGRVPGADIDAVVAASRALLKTPADWRVSAADHPYTSAALQAATLAVYHELTAETG